MSIVTRLRRSLLPAMAVTFILNAAMILPAELPPPPPASLLQPGQARKPLHPHLPPDVLTLRGNTSWVPILIEGLKAEDSSVRARSAFVLGLIGDDRARPALAELLSDPVRQVRVHAGVALGMLGDARGLGTARAVLTDAEEWVRYYAVQALGRIAFAGSMQRHLLSKTKQRKVCEEVRQRDSERAWKALRRCRDGNDSPYIRQAAGLALERFSDKKKALEPDPVRPTGGDCSPNRQGDQDAATIDDIFESAAEVLWLLADFPFHLGSYPDAIRLNQAVTFLTPHFTDAYEVTAWLLWSDDRPDEAMRWRLKGLRANPGVYDLYFDIGLWYLQQAKDYQKAVRYLRKAAAFECPEFVHHSLAHAYERGGQPEKALAIWERLLKENPDNGVARLNYERIKARLR